MKNRSCACLLTAAVVLSAVPLRAAQTEAVTIPFPRGGSASVGLTNGPILIRSVVLKGRPSAAISGRPGTTGTTRR